MTVTEYYHSAIRGTQTANDFELFSYRQGFFIGYDSDGNLCVVIKSSTVAHTPLLQRTKLISVECNRRLLYTINEEQEENLVHIVRCFSKIEKEKELFLELIDATMTETASDEEVMEVFQTLTRFFSDKEEPSDGELIGLYAELDAILAFSASLQIEDYWQSQDRMKFDFSFTDSLKLEVKATTKAFRTHHFRHEQLVTEMYDIVVLSYMLRHDDEGISLFDHINAAKPLLLHSPKKLLRIEKILKNVSEERLKELKFDSEYTRERRHFYLASTIPKFSETTPDGVANAEYDCNLENLPFLPDESFVSMVHTALAKEISE